MKKMCLDKWSDNSIATMISSAGNHHLEVLPWNIEQRTEIEVECDTSPVIQNDKAVVGVNKLDFLVPKFISNPGSSVRIWVL